MPTPKSRHVVQCPHPPRRPKSPRHSPTRTFHHLFGTWHSPIFMVAMEEWDCARRADRHRPAVQGSALPPADHRPRRSALCTTFGAPKGTGRAGGAGGSATGLGSRPDAGSYRGNTLQRGPETGPGGPGTPNRRKLVDLPPFCAALWGPRARPHQHREVAQGVGYQIPGGGRRSSDGGAKAW